MMVVVLALSLAMIAFLLVDPLKQRLQRRRGRRWHGYFRN